MKKKPFRTAEVGESFWFDHFPGTTHVVSEKSEGNSGQWVCMTCGIPFENQLNMLSHQNARAPKRNHMLTAHSNDAKHVLAWRSFVSGNIEVP